MSDTPILSWLNSHHDARLHVATVDTGTLLDWLADMDASNRSGVRRAWMVGRVLNAQRKQVTYGEVEEWEEARAKELNRNVRTIQLYRYVAEAMEDPKIVTALRISDADLGLKALAQVIRRKRRKRETPSPRPVNKSAGWKKRADRLLSDLPATADQVGLLEDHLEAVEAKLKELRKSPTVQEASAAYVRRLDTAGRNERVPAARWTMGLLAKYLSPQFPMQALTTRQVRDFLKAHSRARIRDRRTGTIMDFRELSVSLLAAVDWWTRKGWCPNVKSVPRAPP